MLKSFPFVVRMAFMAAGCLILLGGMDSPGFAYSPQAPLRIIDSAQNELQITEKPVRVVSLVPYITEMLVAFGQEDVLAGLTREDLALNSGLRKKNVGSYFSPHLDVVGTCRPDLIIAAPSQRQVIAHFSKTPCKLLVMQVRQMEDAFDQMEMLGRLFGCETQALAVIRRNRDELALVQKRVAAIPAEKRKRVVRVMAGKRLMCPGDDSFQNEMIVAAGGIVPRWGQNGFAVSVNPDQWRQFNPQVIYGCDKNEKAVQAMVNRDGWKDVDAVKTGFVTMFPCSMACRVSTHIGYFVHWLAAVLYLDTFSDPTLAVMGNQVLSRKSVPLKFPCVEDACIVNHRVNDSVYKSLVVRFCEPLNAVSTFEGLLTGMQAVGNTYIPMPASLGHMAYGAGQAKADISQNLGFGSGEFTTLMTGAEMDHLAVKKAAFRDMEVTALVTAGVRGNAMRMSKDSGDYYKPGTINIIVMTNRQLTENAMERAIITATEAKSAALLDMDIRSTYSPLNHRATGTGTDNIMVVQGKGTLEPFTGGHTKMGELIAKAVYAGVTEAVFRQNGLKADRDVFQRLAERRLSLQDIVPPYAADTDTLKLRVRLETLLMEPYYASFLESAFAVSDDYDKGLIKDLSGFDDICQMIATRIAGKSVTIPMRSPPLSGELPVVIQKAFGALVTGISEPKQ